MGESHRMKITGKPYSGKPNVRFDEGELQIELLACSHYASSLLYCKRRILAERKNISGKRRLLPELYIPAFFLSIRHYIP
jgi:hypothetical protein